ncbi:MAG: hypothetical protein Q9159_003206 [Coniocarpon cinnabarinum]
MVVVQIPSDSPLQGTLSPQIQAKVAELGWSNSDDTSLTDFILLTLAQGRTQEQLSDEIKDLLEESEFSRLGDFTGWLVGEILAANGQSNPAAPDTSSQAPLPDTNASAPPPNESGQDVPASGQDPNAMDEDLSGVPTGPANGAMQVPSFDCFQPDPANNFHRPSGPKSMRGGAPGGRGGRGSRNNAPEASLHRIKGTANAGRINSHSGRDSPRGAPRGPRGNARNQPGRGAMNGMNVQAAQQAVQPSGSMPAFTAEQQNFMANMMTQNMQMLASMFEQQQQSSQMGGGFNAGGSHQGRGGRSLFDRVEHRNQRGGHHQRQHQQQNQNGEGQNGDSIELTSSMEVESNSQSQRQEPSSTTCKFNLFCTKPDCMFAHSSPAAPPGTEIDMNDECKFGANCKNRKCAGRHPSPASAVANQEPPLCKYYPNCTNPYCTFMHPAGPPCRNGADCTTPDCPFMHNPTPCRFNPCTNPSCQFKHAEGQKQAANKAQAFSKSTWVNPGLQAGQGTNGEHKSERKFADENAAEELLVPGSTSHTEDGPGIKVESAEVA